MKKTLKFLSSVLLIATLGLVNCSKYETGGSSTNGYVVGSYINGLIQSAISGNCAISINFTGFTAGSVVNIAVNGGSLSGLNAAFAPVNAVFSAAYTAAFTTAGNNAAYDVTAFLDGYGSTGQTYLNNYITTTNTTNALAYATVAYPVKYDTFWKNGTSTWTAARRNQLLTNYATMLNAFKVVSDAFNGASSAAAGAAAAQTAASATTGTTLTILNTFAGALGCTVAGLAGCGQLSTFVSIGNFASASGTAAMACARIPRSSCTFGATTTASQAADVASAVSNIGLLLGNNECSDKGGDFKPAVTRYFLRGYDPTINTVYGPNTITNNATSLVSNGATTQILAAAQYPKFGSLVTLGFGNLMPVKEGTTPYPTSVPASDTTNATTLYYGGSNIGYKSVSSCESLGLGSRGFGPNLAVSAQKDLTPVNEVIYALSSNGTAASAYAAIAGAAVDGLTYTAPTSAEQIACNTSFRKKTTIPAALNVGTTLPVLQATSGNGGNTNLLTLCVYGGTSATRNATRAILNAGLGLPTTGTANIGECPGFSSTLAGASTFGDSGLTDFGGTPTGAGGTATNSFPNGK